MTIETSASLITVEAESKQPAIRYGQLDGDGIGNIHESINMFQGEIALPLDLLSVRGSGGLEAAVSLHYSSSGVRDAARTWNIESPTGICGLGWSLGHELIYLDNHGSVSANNDIYYLAQSNGGRVRLHCISQTATEWIFESESYDFSRIVYRVQENLWEITGTSGTVRRYGTNEKNRLKGVKWGGSKGNWSDASNRFGQTNFYFGWMLEEIVNRYGQKITFDYENVEVTIGGDRQYTRAIYLKKIQSKSRHVRFSYAEKINNNEIQEYLAPHTGTGLEAHQDRFQTKYLDAIEVVAEEPEAVVLRVQFLYSVENAIESGESKNPLLYKRYLTGLTILSADGAVPPGLLFEYEQAAPPQPTGLLKRITYPQGGTAEYGFTKIDMPESALSLTLTAADTGAGKPRVWFGPNYVAIARYNESANPSVRLSVYEWNGRWMGENVSLASSIRQIDLETLDVAAYGERLILSFRERNGSAKNLRAFAVERRRGRYGEWEVTELDMPPLDQTRQGYQIVSGEEYVVAAADGDRQLYRYARNPRSRSWESDHLTLPEAAQYVMAGGSNQVAVCAQAMGQQRADYLLQVLDRASLEWKSVQLESGVSAIWVDEIARTNWAISPTFAVASFPVQIEASEDEDPPYTFNVQAYRWNQDYEDIRKDQLLLNERIDSPDGFGSLKLFANGSMVANRRHAFRFNGENWVSYTSTLARERVIGSILDRDLVAFDDDNNVQVIEYSAYENDFIRRLQNVSTAAQGFSTGGGGYVTVDNDLYYRQPDGNLQSIDNLPHNVDKIVNGGPYYLGYQLTTGDAYIQMVRNGQIVGTATQPGGKLVPEPVEEAGSGRLLVNPYAFVSYTGNSFESAETLYLHRVLHFSYSGPIKHFVVSSVTIDDGMGNRAVTSFDYPGEAATDPAGLSSQYSQVIRIRGSADKTITPYGKEVMDYHNGLLPPEPGNEMPIFLNGMVKKQEYRNANGELVRTDSYQYEVYITAQDTDGNNFNTIGQYVRTVGETEEHPGEGDNKLTVQRNYAYHKANGIEQEKQVQNVTLDGSEERVQRHTFAFEIPAYKEDLVRDYCLEPVAQTERLTNSNAVSRRATVWKKWLFQNDREVLAPHTFYQALSANASMRDSDWDGTTTPPEDMWLQRSQIEARNEAGEIIEAIDKKGLRRSKQYDRDDYFEVAEYPNASRQAGQATSISFEDYENADGWQLNGDEAGLWQARILNDCHAGSYSLRLTNQTLRRANSFTDPEARKYLLTCWIKTESNYGTGGKARWSATLDGDTKLTAEIEPTNGVWRYYHWRFEMPATNSAKELVLELTGVSGAAVLVDGIRFSPVKCDYLKNYYEKLHLELSDIEKLGGATVRSREAEDGSFSCEVMPEERPLKLIANYQTRQSGSFNPAAPNHSLSIYSCGWSNYQRFNSGELDGASWESDDMTRWTTAEAALVHTAGQENWILYKGAPAATRYAIAVSAKGEEIQHRLGLRWSDGSTLTWNPAAAKWSFTPSSGTAREWDAPARLKLDADKHAGDLDAGNVSDELRKELAAEGLPLGEATVTAIESGKFWIINSGIILKGKAICYYLSRHGNDIWTLEAPRSWLAIVDGNRLAFFADGARIGTWEVSSALNPVVGVIATDAVSFRNFTIATDMAIELKFKNGAGQVVQEQAIGINEVIARAAFYDDRGNSEVQSLFARLTPGAEDMYKQIDNLANLDRSNYQMSGLVKDQNPNAGYFAYSRSKYEDSPLSRIVEQGWPGAELAIGNGHTARRSYGINGSEFGLTPNTFYRETIIDADNGETIKISDKVGRTVLRARKIESDRYLIHRFYYTPRGDVRRIEYPKGNTTVMEYDFLGYKIGQQSANQNDMSFMYDSAGRMRFRYIEDGGSNVVRYWKYDIYSRILETGAVVHPFDEELKSHVNDPNWPNTPPTIAYSYDGLETEDPTLLGRLHTSVAANQIPQSGQTDPWQVETEYGYDERGNKIRKGIAIRGELEASYELTFGYNGIDRLISSSVPDEGETLEIAYRRDPFDRVEQLEVNGSPRLEYSYDNNSHLTGQRLLGNNWNADRTYTSTPFGWPKSVSGPGFSEDKEYFTGGYPDDQGYYTGRPAKIVTAARAGQPAYTRRMRYNPVGWLTDVDYGSNQVQNDAYDDNGNPTVRAEKTLRYYDGGDRIEETVEAGKTTNYQHDARGNVSREQGDDRDRSTTADWAIDRPLQVTVEQAETTKTIDYRYDGQKRRAIAKVKVADNAETQRFYLRDPEGRPLAIIEPSSGKTTCLVHDSYGLALAKEGSNLYFISLDSSGSVRAALDTSGNLVASYDYRPFGKLHAVAGSNPELLSYRFTARELDESDLYDFSARLYDPQTSRFVSIDPKHQDGSPYIYANNSPLLLVEKEGEFGIIATILIGAGIGAGVGAASGAISGGIAIAQNNLKGGEAAGVFFGSLGIGVAVGAATGAIAGPLGAKASSLSSNLATGSVVGASSVAKNVAAQAGIYTLSAAVETAGSTVSNVATAALMGDDIGEAAWKGAVIGAAAAVPSTIMGGLANNFGHKITGKIERLVRGANRRHRGQIDVSSPEGLTGDLRFQTKEQVIASKVFGMATEVGGGTLGAITGELVSGSLDSEEGFSVLSVLQAISMTVVSSAVSNGIDGYIEYKDKLKNPESRRGSVEGIEFSDLTQDSESQQPESAASSNSPSESGIEETRL